MKTWQEFFALERDKNEIKKLHNFLEKEYASKVIYPSKENIIKAFDLTPLDQVKVVIVGQDPYHEKGQAQGLAFSVPEGAILPPSLRNIYKEMENDLHVDMDFSNGDLSYLASQGVLLLNTILTVEEGKPLSHNIPEYKILLMDVLKTLDDIDNPMVFILWGGNAKKLIPYITNQNHLILTSAHPSPLSANQGGFFNQHHFSKTNEFLLKHNLTPIEWKRKNSLSR